MLYRIGGLVAAIIQFHPTVVMFQSVKHEPHQFLHIDTGLDGILASRVHKLMPPNAPIQTRKVSVLSPSEHHTGTDNGKLAAFTSCLPGLMNLFRNQLGYAVWGVGHRQRGFLLQFLGSTVRGYGTGENYFPDAMPFGKGTDVLRTTDICFKICRIGMTGSAMNGGEVKDHIIGSDIYFSNSIGWRTSQ